MYRNYLFSHTRLEYLIKHLLYLKICDVNITEMLIDRLPASRDIFKAYII